ncbi:MAG: dienelactone hydrolase family protein [Armatimonadota bacterium]|nr:dienelactone hydrolase family protein [Armatimonadota bacterium]MDR7450903.1 dienelactone hydrolase family protein [Armatimonadota bacterium]MDR7465825.1 dienelactone hydrolase family protein [Armatimonadota bacterium]MDR7493733.1 dienelactone hydrolase family protein [Armatimonadota bacterium]MDR7498339.1 dienelactone hydrolase family protein [Armatimonadota bacterium]
MRPASVAASGLAAMLLLGAAAVAQPDLWITVPGADGGTLRAAVFRPPAKGSFPAVFVFHGINGLSASVVDWGPALARAGFVTVIGCYFSAGWTLRAGDDMVDPCPRARGIFDADLLGNAAALIAAGRRLSGVRGDRIGLLGHAMGGNLALVLASSEVRVGAVVSISANPLRPLQLPHKPSGSALPAPIWSIERLHAPAILFHGALDAVTPPTAAHEYVQRARALGKNVQAHYYEGTGQDLWQSDRRADLIRRSARFLAAHLRR